MNKYDDPPKQVYAMQHKVTKRIYIGKSSNVQQRIQSHLSELRSGRHTVELMQEDVNKYGCDFDFFILDTIDGYKDYHKEHDWMDKLNTGDKACGYNYKDVHFRNRRKDVEITPGIPISNKDKDNG